MKLTALALLCLLFLSFSFTYAEVTVESYTLIVVKGQAKEFRLVYNPTTGSSWWVHFEPGSLNITKVRTDAGTITCRVNDVGCGQAFDVFSFYSTVVGNYEAEFRLGHDWNHDEYYSIATVRVWVVDRDDLWIRNTLYKDSTGFYFTQPCSMYEICIQVIAYLDFKTKGLDDWAKDQVGRIVDVRVATPYYIVLEAYSPEYIVITTSMTTVTNVQPSNFISKMIQDFFAWLQCLILKRC